MQATGLDLSILFFIFRSNIITFVKKKSGQLMQTVWEFIPHSLVEIELEICCIKLTNAMHEASGSESAFLDPVTRSQDSSDLPLYSVPLMIHL
jgi:hypothetical protein